MAITDPFRGTWAEVQLKKVWSINLALKKKSNKFLSFKQQNHLLTLCRFKPLPTVGDAFILTDDRLFCITNGKAFDTDGKEILS